MSRSFLSRLIFAFAFCLGALSTAPARAQHTPQEAQTFIHDLAQQAISTVAQKQISDTERNERFRRLFVSAFDLPDISRFVLARYWRGAPPEQQQEFIKLFEEMQVLTWAKRFKDYQGQSLEVSGATQEGEQGFTVDSQIAHPPAAPYPLQWHVHQGENGQLQITDIVVEGVSMKITTRSEYNGLLQANGGKIDGLLMAMKSKVEQLKAAN
jgi:phospholipid transport system substrate-binding protein